MRIFPRIHPIHLLREYCAAFVQNRFHSMVYRRHQHTTPSIRKSSTNQQALEGTTPPRAFPSHSPFPAPWLEAHLRQQIRPIFQRGPSDSLRWPSDLCVGRLTPCADRRYHRLRCAPSISPRFAGGGAIRPSPVRMLSPNGGGCAKRATHSPVTNGIWPEGGQLHFPARSKFSANNRAKISSSLRVCVQHGVVQLAMRQLQPHGSGDGPSINRTHNRGKRNRPALSARPDGRSANQRTSLVSA